jgi:predicted DNA-binding protein (MmcQ/YjbR family)
MLATEHRATEHGRGQHPRDFNVDPKDEKFAELVEQAGVVPAPYVGRYHWVALERFNVLGDKELKALLREAYNLVLAKLPKKVKAQLS